MEYLRGDSLKDMISHLRAIPPKLTAKFLVQICSALAYAHRCGIVHRDINPSNIIVQPNDNLKILDFGLACPTGTEDFSNLGTAHYMAPEQIDGRPLDPRTDIYALGITAFEMLTGRRPFPEDNVKAIFDLHLSQDIADPGHMISNLPEELREFILKAARCDPDQRYQDMEQAMAVLMPLVKDMRFSRVSLKTIEKRKRASMLLTFTGEHQPALNRLVEVFRAKVKELGADVKMTDYWDERS